MPTGAAGARLDNLFVLAVAVLRHFLALVAVTLVSFSVFLLANRQTAPRSNCLVVLGLASGEVSLHSRHLSDGDGWSVVRALQNLPTLPTPATYDLAKLNLSPEGVTGLFQTVLSFWGTEKERESSKN